MWRRFQRCLGLEQTQVTDTRTVRVSNHAPPHIDHYVPQWFPDNRIISSKYTVWNFIPKNLFEQFRRIANFYFIIIFLVQLIIDTPTSPVTSGLPLFFVIIVTAIKQGYEDWLRHKADNETNNYTVYAVRSGGLVKTRSKNIRVGDIVRVTSDETFPCDLVLLSSCNGDGTCHVTTASLDGETNLKTHTALLDTARLQSLLQLSELHATIECEQPQPDLYRFVGRMVIHLEDTEQDVVRPLGQENLLLRGARLKNTDELFGVAVYTGMETKMALNYKGKSQKRSAVEKSMNSFLTVYLTLLLVKALLSTVLKYWWQATPQNDEPWYNGKSDKLKHVNKFLAGFADFLAFMVLYNYIIPISLYVTVEMQKFLGSLFISWDMALYDEGSNERALVNTSDLNEELGQVEYVFTDKTGTLTENDMQFRQCSIGGVKYVEEDGVLLPLGGGGAGGTVDDDDGGAGAATPDSPAAISSSNITPSVVQFFLALALCHTVHISKEEGGSADEAGGASVGRATGRGGSAASQPAVLYYASSPDEKALVEAAQRLGVTFLGLHGDIMEVRTMGDVNRFKLLQVLEFDSNRRCMSVIVEKGSGDVLVITKGAESSILPKVVSGEVERTRHHVDEFAMEGLRTLCLAYKALSGAEYLETEQRLHAARVALQNRDDETRAAFDAIESGLHLLGATGVEDRLQEEVPETIEGLRRAGIKVWVLTGDKQETAVNVSYSCGHLQRGMAVLELTVQTSAEECAETLLQLLKRMNEDGVTQQALVVDGASLSLALCEHQELFMTVCQSCVAVVCCRMAPLQKAKVVRLIKTSSSSPITLAIGDGANDVSMIQEAHVGIGIMGKEGRQAVRNSDYAIARFRFLLRLLLVHGHFYYVRVAELVQYFFYKNVCFIMPQFLYQFYCGFSQQTLYDSAYLTLYNICFTSLPVLLYSLVEQHVKPDMLMNTPALYRDVSRNSLLGVRPFIYWTVLGVFDGLVFYFGVFLLFGHHTSLSSNGQAYNPNKHQMFGNWTLGTMIFTVLVFTVNLKLALDTRYWTWMNHLVTWGSLGFYILFSLFYSGIIWPFLRAQDMYFVFMQLLSSGPAWLGIMLLVTVSLLPDLLKQTVWRTLWPTATQLLQEAVSVGRRGAGVSESTPLAEMARHLRRRMYGAGGGAGGRGKRSPTSSLMDDVCTRPSSAVVSSERWVPAGVKHRPLSRIAHSLIFTSFRSCLSIASPSWHLCHFSL
ncbi:phospholipid-transporting ATPase IF-like isoform X3 [Lampetra fluviatilis]